MHFEVGKKVIAIENHSVMLYKKGQVFELLSISMAPCCKALLLDIGIDRPDGYTLCMQCLGTYNQNGTTLLTLAKRFAPYDDSLSELTAEDIIYSQENIHI